MKHLGIHGYHFLRATIIACLTCLLTVTAGAENYNFIRIAGNVGLSENNVKSIVQDHWGFVWLGTKNGLNRYDGQQTKHYDVDDLEKHCGNHNISALYADADGRLWVGTDKGVYIFDPETERFSLFDRQTADGEQISNWIAQITSDHEGCIWVISPNEGAFRYDPKAGAMTVYRTASKKDTHLDNPQSIVVRSDGDIWLGTNGAGLYRFDPKSGRLTQMLTDSEGHSLAGKNIYTMCDYGDWIVVGEHEGRLMKYNPKTDILAEVQAHDVHYKVIRALAYDGREMFVGTQDGLFVIDEAQGRETQIRENDFQPFGLTDNLIYSLYIDRDDGLWVGTMMSGACYLPRRGMTFNTYLPSGAGQGLHSKRLRDMLTTSDGDVWISDEEGGLNIFHSQTQTVESLPTTIYKGGSNRLGLMEVDGKVWSGIFKNGLDVIDLRTHAITHYAPQDLGLENEGSVYALLRDTKGNIWLGSGGGFYVKSGDMRFHKITTLPDIFSQDIAEDKYGNIWIATMGTGVYKLDPKTYRTEHFTWSQGQTDGISSNGVSSITVSNDSTTLWFATDRGGICGYNLDSGQWTRISKAEGLPDDVAYKVLEDRMGHLWFGTNQGLVHTHPGTGEVMVYRHANGLVDNQFNYKSAAKAGNHLFLIGGKSGMISFMPKLAEEGSRGRKIYITNLWVAGREVRPGGDDGILDGNILTATGIELPYDVPGITLSLSTMNYSGTESDFLEYRLDGLDDTWHTTQDGKGISFTHLPPGSYTFKVRAIGDPDSLTALRVTVRHPWWDSPLAYIIYLLLIAALAYFGLRLLHRRQQERIRQRVERFNEEKDKELLQAKIKFFTDITHEIRTPLTLINSSVESMEEQAPSEAVGGASALLQKNIKAIGKNTRRLLNLTNQLLDFRKMDSNSVTLNFTNIDFAQMMRDIVSRFEPAMSRQDKTLSLDMHEDGITLQADQEAVTKIISNLLNNARKYGESFTKVQVQTGDTDLQVRVVNDGPKIPVDKAEAIFQPFVQLDSTHTQAGSGLGLPMARSLAEMHGGTLTLDTTSAYNEFVLTLPLRQQESRGQVFDALCELNRATGTPDPANEPSQTASALDAAPQTVVTTPEKEPAFFLDREKEHTLLVVEDNAEVLAMLTERLSPHYTIVNAKNGQQALNKAHSEHIDLVVSDVMMPVMDGLTLCQRLKEDIETSHIPVIMLTARQTLENRLEGLRAGADAYIEKPFSMVHLLTQAETLLQNRRRERESFVKKPYLPVQSGGITKPEEQFISKITDLILKNIRQPEFNVEQLAAEMCMSRSSLHRKIKEVSDMTPIDFIRLIRLKKAAELIRENGYRSSEVCEMVGITSHSYFIKLFQKQFGMTPKEFAQQKG